MKYIKQAIPNGLTLGNLFCGILAIQLSASNELLYAGAFIVLAAIFDFFDGFAARLLKVESPIGKDLDSLADMVSFGVAPAFIIYNILEIGNHNWINQLVFIFSLAAALRLAKFNNDTRQASSFIGLPSPAAAMVLAVWPWMMEYDNYSISGVLENHWVLIGTTLLLSVLMLAPLPLFSLKIQEWSWEKNRIKFGFLIISIGLLALFLFHAIPIIIFLYILISLMRNFAE